MKDKLHNEIKEYTNQVCSLRKEFNEIKKTGVLEVDFEKKINRVNFNQNNILEKLIPYYRQENIENTEVLFKELEKIGSFENTAIIESTIVFDESNLIVSNSKGELYIVKIDINMYTVEWSEKLDINIKCSYIEKISEERILLLGQSGEMILLEILERKLYNISKKSFKLISQKNRIDEYGFLDILKIEENKYIRKKEENLLEIFEIEISSNKVDIVKEKRQEIYTEKEIISSSLVLGLDRIIIGTDSGNVYIYRKNNSEYIFDYSLDIFNQEVSNISKLDSDGKDIAIFSSDGNFKVYSFNNKEIHLKENKKIDGSIFELESKESTGLMIGQEGVAYIIEENMGSWYVNSKKIEKFFIEILAHEKEDYLLFDLDSNIYLLYIDRIRSVEDMYNKIKFS